VKAKHAEWQICVHLTLGDYLQGSGKLFQLLWLFDAQNNQQIVSQKSKKIIINL